jgi:capsular polysaccharide biosynthesis protein
MTQTTADAGSRFWWAMRRYRRLAGGLFLVVLALTAVLVGRQAMASPTYEASALVIANRLDFRAEQLPRLAEEIFTKDSVAQDAIAAGKLPWTREQLLEDHAELTPLEENVLLEVTGRARDPRLAARTANSLASALAEALNRPGAGVGVFSVQHQAAIPTRPASSGFPVAELVGGFAGATAVSLGAVGLVLAVRRPLIEPGEAGEATGTPVVGVVLIGNASAAKRSEPVRPEDVPGLAALCRTLFPDGRGGYVLSAPPEDGERRSGLAAWLVRALEEHGSVVVVPQTGAPCAVAAHAGDAVTVAQRPFEKVPPDAAIVVDGFDDDGLAARQVLPEGAQGVLVVAEGTARSAAAAAVEQFPPGDLAGVVFVR